MTAMMRTRAPWPLPRWQRFTLRCQALRDRVSGLIRTFPATRGLKPGHINLMIRVHGNLMLAMMGLEDVIERQHPEAVGRAMRIIHGPKGTSGWGKCHGRTPRDAPILSRQEWVELGREVKAIRAELMALLLEVQETATKPYVRRFDKACRALDSAKCRLDSLACAQHPDWPEFTRVFYGPDTAATGPPGARP